MQRFIIIFIFTTAAISSSSPNKFSYDCPLNKPKLDSSFPTITLNSLELQTSHRVTHQLVTRVFAVFLKEILGFQATISDKLNENPFLSIPNDEKAVEYYPLMELAHSALPAINLEVWITPDSHVIFPDGAKQGGSLSNDLARYGLFIMESFGDKTYSYKDFIVDVNSSYSNTIQEFEIDNRMENILKNLVEKSNTGGGIYRPSQCDSTSESCATVLTSHYNDTKFFVDHVKRLKLKMNIYFLGERLPEAIRLLNTIVNMNVNQNTKMKKTMRYMVFHWTPSEIIDSSIKYKPVTMPTCEVYKDQTNNCRYDLIPVTVYFNEKVFKESDDLMDILRRLRFPSLKPLIELYRKYEERIENVYKAKLVNGKKVEDYYNEIACKWLQQNKNVYTIGEKDSWIKTSYDLNEISIGGIFPQNGTGREYAGIMTAITMAEDFVNDHPNILPGYKLEVKRAFSDCKPDLVLRHFINYYSHRKHLVGVLGPSCSEAIEPLAGISKHFKMSVITYSAEGVSFADRDKYPYFFRTIGETKQYEDVYVKLLTALDWKRLAALTEDGMKYTQYITDMDSVLKENNIQMLTNKKFSRESSEAKQMEAFMSHLRDLKDKHNAKIIIADVHDYSLIKTLMCAAFKSQMTARFGYVFFLPVYMNFKSMKINNSGLAGTNGTCSEKELSEAFDGHISLSYSSFGEDTDVIETNSTVAKWKQEYLEKVGFDDFAFADYAGFTYDAIWVYVKALQELIKADEMTQDHPYMRNLYSDKTMQKLASLIGNMDFQGVSGRIQFHRGSRFTDIDILQWQKNDFTLIGQYKPKITNESVNGELHLNKNIIWFSNDKPEDGREKCSLQALANVFNANCHTMITFLLFILCSLVVITCSVLSFLFWKRKYDKKLIESEKFIGNYLHILNGAELTKWEVQRENVVINRRLGEGAFGTVYGGEALIDETEGWTAVAIKTLNAGSNAENRLDFLAESETMKRFDHKNIVKLLGVCLQSEPLYNIMEFMLYGDLKTYLLARRQLVNEKLTDESDISPKRLTLMALDVARGLSYLASMNYVHRDVACRNCMINAQRIVKIGDFGMARSTLESNYYRFVRKGMLPVRWMAPESVDGGLFSQSSDIWSYGVLLYEIVTLGAFPFQGLNNNQVLEHVRSGNSIKIPSTCKPQLKALMSTCFSVDAKKRPEASKVVEYISSFPRMLTPCMDVPKPCLDQVNLIDSDLDHLESFDQLIENRDRSQTPATLDFLQTSVSSSALQDNINHQDPSTFGYLEMKLTKIPNGFYQNEFSPDLTAMLPHGNYNPVEPLLQTRIEISKSNLSLMKYVPMCGFREKSSRSSPNESSSEL